MNETLLPNHGNNIDNWYLLIAPIQIRLILSQTVPDVPNIFSASHNGRDGVNALS